MEGPTPVSALIHAATMVTAGVYLIVRTHSIFEAAPDVQHLSALIGGITIIVAGVIALVQWDIKRVIAYSTMSQIGYMFMAAGIGAYGYAMFHLMTHAFFKALLFLSAGVIIHHLAGEQDIRKMGGLRKVMPLHARRLPRRGARARRDPAALRLLVEGRDHRVGARRRRRARLHAGRDGPARRPAHRAPTRSGSTTSSSTGRRPTSCSSTRAGTARATCTDARTQRATRPTGIRKGPLSMLIPVGVLTVLAAIGGLLVIPGVWEPFLDWIDSAVEPLVSPTVGQEYGTSLIAVTIAGVGIWLARRAFREAREIVARGHPAHRRSSTSSTSTRLYDALFSRPAQVLANRLRDHVEEPIVQGSLGEIGTGVTEVADGTARLQTGLLRSYALVIGVSVAVLIIVFVAVR